MNTSRLTLAVLPERLAICRLEADTKIPKWALKNSILNSITGTPDELSIVCPEADVPAKVRAEKGWIAFKVEGPLDFSLTGILASLAGPLAEADISIFTVSTFETDYVLVKTEKLDEAVKVLSRFCNIKTL
jgi:uncharacterized protein